MTPEHRMQLPQHEEIFKDETEKKSDAKENAGKFASAVKRPEKIQKEYADHLCTLIENRKVEEFLQELKPFEGEK